MYQHNQYPPHFQPPPPKPKMNGCLLAFLITSGVMAAFFTLAVIIGIASSGGREREAIGSSSTYSSHDTEEDKLADSPEPDAHATTEAPAEAPKKLKAPGIGDKVRDDELQFMVTNVERRSSVGNGMFAKTAQGEYVLIYVTVENVGNEGETFSSSSQKLYDTKGREFDTDGSTSALALKDSNSFLEKINPGNKVRGILLYDVPKGVKLDRIELHDSFLSGGATVSLR
ncbi:DUF4352 domain-containing protein [Nonomuraea sp. WAC 01424]|uniref:DUF4352 domain-containing protein n=1 Tax=Nonomuraea sp. WAC 01424 TaxID=2203200 RepID=UPI000F787A6B|nr:DUF4352 domain-containing protein [Nonomuraea sp. WAC 01424]RSN09142.1 DUF4352 domain-containing protein [Nonomuraea sp. WAC 01424]